MTDRMVVVAYVVSDLTDEEIGGLIGEAFAQGEASERHPDVEVFQVEVGFTVSTQEELQGVLEVGAGL